MKINLEDFPTSHPTGLKKKKIQKETARLTQEIGKLQHLLYADKRYAVLVIFQGMDASGKDGTTREVFQQCSPMATWAYGFQKPSEEELNYDFLWRVHRLAPKKGRIHIFNRSHYEDILIQRVEKWIDMERVHMRMRAINEFEKLIKEDNHTLILKFYMHISPKRQLEKLKERREDPEKQWKHNDKDWSVREKWEEYMEAYEYILNQSEIPWIITPCDQRWYRNYFVAVKVLEAMKSLELKLPPINTKMGGSGEE